MKITKEDLTKLVEQTALKIYTESKKGEDEKYKGIEDKIDAYEKALEEIKMNNPLVPENAEEEVNEFEGKIAAIKLFKSLANMDLPAQKWLSEYKATFDTATTTQGGYIVPDAFLADVIEEMAKIAVIRPLATIHSVANQGGDQPAITAKITAAYGSEETATTEVVDTFAEYTYTLVRLDINVIYSREMELFEKSSEGLYNMLVRQMAEAINDKEESMWISGTGSSQPEGILNASTVTITNKITVSGVPAYKNLTDVYYAIPARYRKRAVWVVSGNMLGALRNITDDNSRPLWIDNLGADNMRIFGAPVLESEEMTDTDIICADLSYYHIYEVPQMWLQATREGKELVSKRQVYIGAWKFNDGQPVLANAYGILDDIQL